MLTDNEIWKLAEAEYDESPEGKQNAESWFNGFKEALSQSIPVKWSILQAMIRCGLANSPTDAFVHQVLRVQQEFAPDSKEFNSITEMLYPDPNLPSSKIVQSSG